MSIDQHLFYCLKVNLSLKLSFLPYGLVKYVPIKDNWYNTKKVRRYLSLLNNIEFLFIDGPTEIIKPTRNSKHLFDCISPYLSTIKMVVIDDVNRKENNNIAEDFVKKLKLKRYDVRYGNKNNNARKNTVGFSFYFCVLFYNSYFASKLCAQTFTKQ